MNDTEILSEQATIRSMVRGASHQPNDEAVLDDLDLVIESLAQQGEREEAERLRRAQRQPAPTYTDWQVSNAILDVIDEGHMANGHHWHWRFDYDKNEDLANAERLDFRDAVLARLKR